MRLRRLWRRRKRSVQYKGKVRESAACFLDLVGQ